MSWVRPPHWPGILTLTPWTTSAAIYADSYFSCPVIRSTQSEGFSADLTTKICYIWSKNDVKTIENDGDRVAAISDQKRL